MKDYEKLICTVMKYRNNYEADKMLEYFTDDIKYIIIDDNTIFVEGKTDLKTMIEETKEEDRYHWTLDNITTTGNKIVTFETVTKPHNNTIKYIFIYEVRDNQINKVWMTTQ